MPFEDRFKQILQLAEAINLNVLIWGPGPQAGEHSQKREKIRQEIKGCFRNADVQFSEDLVKTVPGYEFLSLPEQELWHLVGCDVCVVLDNSKGPGEEIAHFAGTVHAYKLIILTHEKYKDISSFPASIREYCNQFFYNDEQYDTCTLVERVITRLRQVALAKMSGLYA